MASRLDDAGRPVCDGLERDGTGCDAPADYECQCLACGVVTASEMRFHACRAHRNDMRMIDRHRDVTKSYAAWVALAVADDGRGRKDERAMSGDPITCNRTPCRRPPAFECACAACATRGARNRCHACEEHTGEMASVRFAAGGAAAVWRDLRGPAAPDAMPSAAGPCNAVCEARDGVPCERVAAGHAGLHRGGARHPLGPVFWGDGWDACDRAALLTELVALREAIAPLEVAARRGGELSRDALPVLDDLVGRYQRVFATLYGARYPAWALAGVAR